MYFQWWRKANYSEQCKGEKAADKGLTTSIGYKGTDEFEVLKASITDLNDKLVKLTDELKCKSHLYSAVINSSGFDSIAQILKNVIVDLGHDTELNSEINEKEIGEANTLLQGVGLLDTNNRPKNYIGCITNYYRPMTVMKYSRLHCVLC